MRACSIGPPSGIETTTRSSGSTARQYSSSGVSIQRVNREPAFPTSRKEPPLLMIRISPARGTAASPGAAGGLPDMPPSGLFDIFRLAARAHGPLSDALKPLAALFATVIPAFHPFVELDIDRSAYSTHLVITRRVISSGEYKILSRNPRHGEAEG